MDMIFDSGMIISNADMQKVATMRPLVAEIFSDYGRIKDGILLILWKLSA